MLEAPAPIIRELRVRAVELPMPRPVQMARRTIASAPMVLIDLQTEYGVTGSSYLLCYVPALLKPLVQIVRSMGSLAEKAPLSPLSLHRMLREWLHMPGWQGLACLAIAGIDMAAWDALAKTAKLPLAVLLGGNIEPIPAHGSLFSIDPIAVAAEAEKAVTLGFTAVKVKVGRSDLDADLEVIGAIRSAVGPKIGIMVDYNQSLSFPEAQRRVHALDDLGLIWIEEPTRADDFDAHATIAREARTPIQLGENWWGVQDAVKSISAKASDHAMLDVMRMGGVTGWLQAAAVLGAAGLPVTSHLFPEFSGHLLAVTPTRQWLESYVGGGSAILRDPIKIENGHAILRPEPGAGIEWNEDVVQKHLVD